MCVCVCVACVCGMRRKVSVRQSKKLLFGPHLSSKGRKEHVTLSVWKENEKMQA